jgi:type II secretory pathway pseudopilin PulG
VVVLLIGIVSAIAMRQLGQTRVQAYQAAMRADLRNFAVAEESYFYDNGVYASSPAAVTSGGFLLTPGVSLVVNEATSVGWSATSGHLRTDVKCYLFVESAAPVGSATEAGKLDCS